MHPWKGRWRGRVQVGIHGRGGPCAGGHPQKGSWREHVQVDIYGMGRGRRRVLGGTGMGRGHIPTGGGTERAARPGAGPALSEAGQTNLWVWGEVRIHGGAG